MKESRTRTVTITITERCNLSCSYCYEQHKSNRRGNISIIKEIVDQELCKYGEYDEFEFDLFGGEPFIEFDLVKEITEYICEKKGDIPCTVFATTNGTMVHGVIQDWLEEHKNCFVCGLSLDGTKEMHDINRSNSYDKIDLDFFLRMYPQQDVKMTISQETLPNLADGVISMHEKGFLVSCNLAYGIDWRAPQNTTILSRELHKLIEYYLRNPKIEPCSMLSMGINNVIAYQEKATRFCGSGIDMIAYDIEGRAYPCQFFMPLSIGETKAKMTREITFPEVFLPEDEIDEKCKECVLKSCCPNCYGANYAATGNIYKRSDDMCRLTKITLKARAYFRARQWELGQLNETPDDLQALLRAIIRIQEELQV